MNVAINCANARNGGAIQVSVAILEEVLGSDRYRDRYPWTAMLRCVVSPEVFDSLSESVRQSPGVSVVEGATRREWTEQTARLIRGSDVVYTVFAPWYGRKLAPVTISGFADGQWVHPRALRGAQLIRYLLRKPIAGYLYRRERALVHQTPESLAGLRRYPGFQSMRMEIAPNCLNPLFVQGVRELDARTDQESDLLTMVYVARYYPYKNHSALAQAQDLLAREGIDSVCIVTMTDAEWSRVPEEVRVRFRNVGIQPISALGAVYANADIAIFPSLNESFSASPIEALYANGILVASDRSFVRDACGEVARYVEPDAEGIAQGIRDALAERSRWPEQRARAREFATSMPTSADMTDVIMRLVDEFVQGGDGR